MNLCLVLYFADCSRRNSCEILPLLLSELRVVLDTKGTADTSRFSQGSWPYHSTGESAENKAMVCKSRMTLAAQMHLNPSNLGDELQNPEFAFQKNWTKKNEKKCRSCFLSRVFWLFFFFFLSFFFYSLRKWIAAIPNSAGAQPQFFPPLSAFFSKNSASLPLPVVSYRLYRTCVDRAEPSALWVRPSTAGTSASRSLRSTPCLFRCNSVTEQER